MPICKVSCATDYDKPVEFLAPPTAENPYNEVVLNVSGDWLVALRTYASVETGSGREVYYAKQVHSEVGAVIKCRWTPATGAINADNRVRVNGSTYEILYADNTNEANEEMRFGCRKVTT